MKILHITNWYPNRQNLKGALWIKAHVDALHPFVSDYSILHLEIQPSHRFKFHKDNFNKCLQRIVEIPTRSWFLLEILSALLLGYYLIRLNVWKYHVINCHIAYPNLTYWHWVKKFVGVPLIITEHWSAYHFNFGVKKTLPRIQRIFRQKTPVIAVSSSLVRDIKKFSNSDFTSFVVPNVVDTNIFYYRDSLLPPNVSFFMLSQWKWPKDPFTPIKAFAKYIHSAPAKLRIGGYGPQLNEMKILVEDLGLGNYVTFLGTLGGVGIANEFNQASAFLHCSAYESFSVVCAESLCCGCPVVASSVGGIREFVNGSNGILLTNNSTDKWAKALHNITEKEICRRDISVESKKKFDKDIIGQKYFNILDDVISRRKK